MMDLTEDEYQARKCSLEAILTQYEAMVLNIKGRIDVLSLFLPLSSDKEIES